MPWHCIIIVEGERPAACAGEFVGALRRMWRAAGEPEKAAVFVNWGSASRLTFLLSPEAAMLAPSLLARHEAMACAQAPDLKRYAPLHL